MDSNEEKIRTRAYELWERADRTGAPEDHWLQAERQVMEEEQASATVQDATPLAAVEAIEAAGDAPANGKGRREKKSPAKAP
jgi:hypothetical protein